MFGIDLRGNWKRGIEDNEYGQYICGGFFFNKIEERHSNCRVRLKTFFKEVEIKHV